MSRYRRALHIFRRDLRLADNTALGRAADMAEEVVPCFVFDPRQCDAETNPYFGVHAFQFLIGSLRDLEAQLATAGGVLHRFRGEAHAVVGRLVDEAGVEAVFVNRDYTPFSRARDTAIQEACAARGVPFHRSHDLLLTAPGRVLTGSGTPYQVYSAFARTARRLEVPRPEAAPPVGWYLGELPGAEDRSLYRELLPTENPRLFRRGGRAEALAILGRLGELGEYGERRDLPADEDGTTGLSAHHKLGTVSIREVYHAVVDALDDDHGLIGELYWRDFFTHLAYFHPHVFGQPFRHRYEALEWRQDDERFDAWRHGRTGFPIVDAGMRQLARTGFMHNRVRMIVASFLTKDLHIDWRRGERHFARLLVDYDPAVNNGNWQWAASTGADAQPWFRIFNPWRQQQKHDPETVYVKRWVPELAHLESRSIHRLAEERPAGLDYPEPLVEHRAAAARAKEIYRRARVRDDRSS